MRIIPLILALLILAPASAGAKGMADLLLSMPDSVVPYLNADIRSSMLRQHSEGGSNVQSLLHEDVAIDTIDDDYMKLKLSESSSLEAMKLTADNGDQLLCVVKTCYGPAAESTVELYDTTWHRLPPTLLPQVAAADLVARPDTMSNASYELALSQIAPLLVSVEAEPESHSLVYSLTLPLPSKEARGKLQAILKPRKYAWDGSRFH